MSTLASLHLCSSLFIVECNVQCAETYCEISSTPNNIRSESSSEFLLALNGREIDNDSHNKSDGHNPNDSKNPESHGNPFLGACLLPHQARKQEMNNEHVRLCTVQRAQGNELY